MVLVLNGNLARAWQTLHINKMLCSKCISLWHFNSGIKTSYVPLAVKKQVMPEVRSSLPWRSPTIEKVGQKS
jgi:hypothetical protein